MTNKSEYNAHLKRNEKMWQIWEENGIDLETQFVVHFHFYATQKENTELLSKALSNENIPHSIEKTTTLIFLKGWRIQAEIKKKWTLAKLQEKTANLFLHAKQTRVSLEGCGTFIPN